MKMLQILAIKNLHVALDPGMKSPKSRDPDMEKVTSSVSIIKINCRAKQCMLTHPLFGTSNVPAESFTFSSSLSWAAEGSARGDCRGSSNFTTRLVLSDLANSLQYNINKSIMVLYNYCAYSISQM
jgi:hypothetical protein